MLIVIVLVVSIIIIIKESHPSIPVYLLPLPINRNSLDNMVKINLWPDPDNA